MVVNGKRGPSLHIPRGLVPVVVETRAFFFCFPSPPGMRRCTRATFSVSLFFVCFPYLHSCTTVLKTSERVIFREKWRSSNMFAAIYFHFNYFSFSKP